MDNPPKPIEQGPSEIPTISFSTHQPEVVKNKTNEGLSMLSESLKTTPEVIKTLLGERIPKLAKKAMGSDFTGQKKWSPEKTTHMDIDVNGSIAKLSVTYTGRDLNPIILRVIAEVNLDLGLEDTGYITIKDATIATDEDRGPSGNGIGTAGGQRFSSSTGPLINGNSI